MEWDVALVVVDGRVNYVDLRIRPGLLGGFVGCLVDDVGDEQAAAMRRELAAENDLDLDAGTE